MKTGLTISAIAHAALLLWCALSFSVAPLVAAAPDSLPVDIISDTQFSQLTKGNKTAPKAEPRKRSRTTTFAVFRTRNSGLSPFP